MKQNKTKQKNNETKTKQNKKQNNETKQCANTKIEMFSDGELCAVPQKNNVFSVPYYTRRTPWYWLVSRPVGLSISLRWSRKA